MSVEVWIDQRHVGNAVVEVRPGFQKPSLTFSYLDSWLADTRGFAISPDLPLKRGPHTPAPHRVTFLAFDDAAPDKWGRDLLDARARMEAKESGKPIVWPTEIDRLFAVDDETRQGALRFRKNGEFLSLNGARAGIHELPALAKAAQRFVDSGEIDEDMANLIGAGSSPGGAQPKAWVRGEQGEVLMAKFPRGSDNIDASAWELTAIKLQDRAGIQVQPSRIVPLGFERSVFLTRRFDRKGGTRIPYMSFKNAFAIQEFENPDYATLAKKVAHISANPDKDAAELFSRAAMLVMLNNIDDHMRNHGLLRSKNGWQLSPSFDVNPARQGRSSTPLTPQDDPGNRDIRLLVEAADDFRLTQAQAVERIKIVNDAVSHWREDAASCGIAEEEIAYMESAFENLNRERAAAMRPATATIIDMSTITGSTVSSNSSISNGGDIWVQPHTRRGKPVEGHFRRRRN